MDPFLGQISIFAFPYAPKGWAKCDGQRLPIAQNQALFSLLGNTFGGDGKTKFALPDLRGRVPIHWGVPVDGRHVAYKWGQQGGEEEHPLSSAELPPHIHSVIASGGPATTTLPGGNAVAVTPTPDLYGGFSNTTPMNPDTIRTAGQGQPHPNMQPYLALVFCIALVGTFPPHSKG